MSSRLLSMKFMQRAAASASSAPESPQGGPPSKRQKVADSPRRDSDLIAAQSALAAEEAKRDQAIQRQAAEAGETRWVLSFKDGQAQGSTPQGRRVVEAGYASIDGSRLPEGLDHGFGTPDHGRSEGPGRRSFGKFNRRLEKSQRDREDSSSSEEEEDSESESEERQEDSDATERDPSDADALIRSAQKKAKQQAKADRKAARQAEKARAAADSEERPQKRVKLNKLTSISGTGGGKPNDSRIQCYKCGGRGHIAQDCTTPKKPSHANENEGERNFRTKKKSKRQK